jgi:hypothetical protein
MKKINNDIRRNQKARFEAYLKAADSMGIDYPKGRDLDATVIWLSKQDYTIWQAVCMEAENQSPELFTVLKY